MLVLHPEIAALWQHYKQIEEHYYHKGLGYSGEAAGAQSLTEKGRYLRLSFAYYLASWEAEKIALVLEDLYFPNSKNALRGRKHPMSRSAYKPIEKIFARPDVKLWLQIMSRKHAFELGMSVMQMMESDYGLTMEGLEDGQKVLIDALDLPLEEVRMREKQLQEEIPLDTDQRYPHLLRLRLYALVREQREIYGWSIMPQIR